MVNCAFGGRKSIQAHRGKSFFFLKNLSSAGIHEIEGMLRGICHARFFRCSVLLLNRMPSRALLAQGLVRSEHVLFAKGIKQLKWMGL